MSPTSKSPLARFFSQTTKIEPGEGPAVAVAFLLYFCILGGYFAVRPVRETVGTILGSERVSNLFVVTWIVTLLIVPIYGAICARFQRKAFLPWIYGFVALALAACGFMLRNDEGNLAVGQFFYVLISVLNLFVVSVLWSFLLELFNPRQTKRLFGVIAAGGTTGALVGPMLTDLVVGWVGNSGILFLGSGMFVIAIVCQRILLRIWTKAGWETHQAPAARDRPIGGNPFAGFTLVLKSPYLIGIALFVILLAAVNTFLYFEQLELVRETFSDTTQRTRIFSRLDYIVQSLTVASQLFLTGRFAAKWGVGFLLTLVPLVMVIGMLLLASFHTFATLAIVIVARRVGEYAFVKPGREMLFSPLGTETKYKAKNFIDVPVYRGGDALVAKITAGLSGAGLSPALFGAAAAALWAGMGWWLGRRREHLAVAGPPESKAVPAERQAR